MSLDQLRNGVVLGCVLAALTACSESTSPGVDQGTVTLNPAASAVGVRQDESETMVVKFDRGGYTGRVELSAAGVPHGVLVYFSPSRVGPGADSAIMTIAAGVPATPGVYPITITAQGVEPGAVSTPSTVNLTIIPAIVVSVTPSPVGLHAGAQQQLAASVTNTTNTGVTWSSSNTAVATVSSTGVVTAVSRGTATITARSVANTTRFGTGTVNVLTTAITPPATFSGLGAATGVLWWYVDVPAGTTQLRVQISGGTGDVDLYIYNVFGTFPTASGRLCRPFLDGNNETCVLNDPAPGRYFIGLDTFQEWSGVTMSVTTTP
jgi:uncharacterized protein YjdB